ncbi:RHS repeat-associated core domain-containing protein, partial [Bacteroides uniformis]
MPTGVTFASGGFIQHGYTADGIKRRMMYKEADG